MNPPGKARINPFDFAQGAHSILKERPAFLPRRLAADQPAPGRGRRGSRRRSPGRRGRRDLAEEGGHEAFDLGVVEDHAVHLVPEQAGRALGIVLGDEIRRHMHLPGLDPGRGRDEVIDLVPGQPFVVRDVEGFADRPAVPECGLVRHWRTLTPSEQFPGSSKCSPTKSIMCEAKTPTASAGPETTDMSWQAACHKLLLPRLPARV